MTFFSASEFRRVTVFLPRLVPPSMHLNSSMIGTTLFRALPQARGWRVFAAVMAWLAVFPAAVAQDDDGADDSAYTVGTRRLLEKLSDPEDPARQMPDVVLWILERINADPDASAGLKKEVPFRRATALVASSRNEADAKKRQAIYDEADREIDRFLADAPTSRQAIDAYWQKGNLLIQRARAKVELAKRPDQDPKKLLPEAVGLFDRALTCLQGQSKPGEEITEITNAEDAIKITLRDVDQLLAELKAANGGAVPTEPTKPTKPTKPTAAGRKPEATPNRPAPRPRSTARKRPSSEEKRLVQLEEQQEFLRQKLLQTRLMVGETLFEKAKAFEAGSADWKTALEESAARHNALARQYPNKAAGVFAQLYEGRNYALLGKADQAVQTLNGILEIQEQKPLVLRLKAQALNFALPVWIGDKEKKLPPLDDAKIDAFAKFALAPVKPPLKLDADWLGVKYHTAALLDARAAGLPAGDKKKSVLQRDARKLAVEVARAGKEFAKEARELAGKLGNDLPNEPEEEATFAALLADANGELALIRAKKEEAKTLTAAGDTAAAATAATAATAARDKAMKLLGQALTRARGVEVADINRARSNMASLLYDAGRFHDAVAIAGFLAERYPKAAVSPQSARIVLASLDQLARQGDGAWQEAARERRATFARYALQAYPNDTVAGAAVGVLVQSASESGDPEKIVALIDGLPADAAGRGDVLQRAGVALWREVQVKRQLDESDRPAADKLDAWKAKARQSLDEGIAVAGDAPVTPGLVNAALSRANIAIDDGDIKAAGAILEHPLHGPWTVVSAARPEFSEGRLAEAALIVSLRYFILAQESEKAQQCMALLEKVAGDPGKLTNLYRQMGLELQGQLEGLAGGKTVTAESRDKAARILTGFEQFLDKIADRDEKISSQFWVASTYLTLGSGTGLGAIVAKDKAKFYLDRAAAVFGKLLQKGGAEIADFEPQIRFKLAGVLRELERFDDAQKHIDWIFSEPKRQNLLDAQIEAAELLEAAGRKAAAEAAGNKEKFTAANTLLGEAVVGRKAAGIWGWGNLATKVARQVGSGGRADEVFFEARLRIARCMAARAQLPGQDSARREKLLTEAASVIIMTRKLYPALGGDASRRRFDSLLREVQKLQGVPSPGGFKDVDEQEARAAAAAAATK
jgi:hypothetical protein